MSRFVEENNEIPSALQDLIGFYRSPDGLARLNRWAALAALAPFIGLVGMGTSEYTGESFASRLSVRGRAARSFDAGELLHQPHLHFPRHAQFVLTSQSGESAEIRKLTSQQVVGDYVAVTNDERSTLAGGAALVLPLCAGHEATITTKTYVNNLALCRLMEAALISENHIIKLLGHLNDVAHAIEELDHEGLEAAAQILLPDGWRPSALAFVGRGEGVVTARQCALTFMEGLKRPTSAYTGGAFRHGPFEAVGADLGVVLLRSSARTAPLIDRLALDVAGRGSPVVVLNGQRGEARGGVIRVRLPTLPKAEEHGLYPILAARSHNLLLHLLAGRLSLETGVFRYGAKVTDKE